MSYYERTPEPAFAAGAALPVRARTGAARRGPRRPARAELGSGAGGGDEELAESRVGLERLLALEMVPMKGARAECACIWCAGAKVRACSWCGGRGVRQEFLQKSWEELATDIEAMQSGEAPGVPEMPKVDVQCSACSGSKTLRCGYCRGSGIGSYGHAY